MLLVSSAPVRAAQSTALSASQMRLMRNIRAISTVYQGHLYETNCRMSAYDRASVRFAGRYARTDAHCAGGRNRTAIFVTDGITWRMLCELQGEPRVHTLQYACHGVSRDVLEALGYGDSDNDEHLGGTSTMSPGILSSPHPRSVY